MKIQVFNIRLDDEFISHDQEVVNNFMEEFKVKQSFALLVNSFKPYWSVIVHYYDSNHSISTQGTKLL